MTLTRTRTLVAGVALIVVTNTIVLGGVAWNRSGEPDSQLTLSQREAGQAIERGIDREKGGLRLQLYWRVIAASPAPLHEMYDHGPPAWLDEAKLTALGFTIPDPAGSRAPRRRYERQLPRGVLIVLEQDGPAYQKALAIARERAQAEAAGKKPESGQRAADNLKREEITKSRLFAVDAGLDAAALRDKYPDRTRYAIVHGKVRLHYRGERGFDRLWEGYIENIDNLRLNVPKDYLPVIASIPGRPEWDATVRESAPFQVAVAFGKCFEPWIAAVSSNR